MQERALGRVSEHAIQDPAAKSQNSLRQGHKAFFWLLRGELTTSRPETQRFRFPSEANDEATRSGRVLIAYAHPDEMSRPPHE